MCNVVKKIERERLEAPGSRVTHADLEGGIADAYSYLDLACQTASIDAAQATQKKFNETSEELGFMTRLG